MKASKRATSVPLNASEPVVHTQRACSHGLWTGAANGTPRRTYRGQTPLNFLFFGPFCGWIPPAEGSGLGDALLNARFGEKTPVLRDNFRGSGHTLTS